MIDTHSLQLSTIVLKNFRCFEDISVDLNSPIVLIAGPNGTGKTSLLEALYYGCYLRSFRTHTAKDLIALQKESFFIKLMLQNQSLEGNLDHTISIGFSDNKRLVKIDNTSTVSYKDLFLHYRVVSLTEDDLMVIKGAPEDRRTFLNQALLLSNQSFMVAMKEFRAILEQRNALLQNEMIDTEVYFIWTKKLWHATSLVQNMRKQILFDLGTRINTMLQSAFDEPVKIYFSYVAKKHSDMPFELFWEQNNSLMKDELYFKRSLFGIHLDDFLITLEGKKSRSFASRGQQKMILLLIKAAQIQLLMTQKGPVIFLLDDFMTDFDPHRGKNLLSILFGLNCQLVFTSPQEKSPLEDVLLSSGRTFKKIIL